MPEIDNRIEDRKLQLGSLNDELRQTVMLVNKKHQEKEELDQIIDGDSGLKKNIKIFQDTLETIKENIIISEHFHELRIKELAEIYTKEQKRIEVFSKSVAKKKRELSELRIQTKELEGQNIIIQRNRKEISKLEEMKTELIGITRLVAEKTAIHRKINTEINLDKVFLQELKTKIIQERTEQRKWLSETKKNAQELSKKAIKRIDDLEIQKKDLKVVEKRLKKFWEKTSDLPFPAIYHT